MIPATASRKNVPAWQRELGEAIRDPLALLRTLDLDPARFAIPENGAFPLRVPLAYVERMRRGDPADPLLLQVLPSMREEAAEPGFTDDPVGDRHAMPHPGVLHKYNGRVLLVTTGACAIHCRYCFRQHFPYSESNPRSGHWASALEYVAARPDIEEVILSGGDPLSLPDRSLAELVRALETIPHVQTLRLHTRMPVVLPSRVDAGLTDWLSASRLRTVVVLHANHPHEIDPAVEAAGGRLQDAGAVLLNQAVLLRGVNDSASTLAELSRRLFAFKALPYYLHLLDSVRGAARFDVSESRGQALLAELAGILPGYLVPRLVREDPGAPGKTPITFAWDAAVGPERSIQPMTGA